MANAKKASSTKAVKRAAKDLPKGSGDAGLALEERRQIKRLTTKVSTLQAKVERLERQVKGDKKK